MVGTNLKTHLLIFQDTTPDFSDALLRRRVFLPTPFYTGCMKTCFYGTFCLLLSCFGAWAQPGALDPSFSEDGYFLESFGNFDIRAERVLVQQDGKIVVGLNIGSFGSATIVIIKRYFPDGTLDTAFHGDGQILIQVLNRSITLVDMMLLPDGKILLGINDCDFEQVGCEALLFQFNEDGTPDTAFGVGGMAETDSDGFFETRFAALIRQPDGKIVAGGSVLPPFSPRITAVFRYFPDGMMDHTLSGTGIATLGVSPTLYAVAVQPDAKILLGGLFNGDVFIARFNPEGTPDSTFAGGLNVIALSGAGDGVISMVVQPDGKILLGGFADDMQGSTTFDFMLMRLLPNGIFDPSFAGSGFVISDVGNDQNDAPRTMLQQPDGRILLGGFIVQNDEQRFAIARFQADGSLDESFGNAGKMIYPFTSDRSTLYHLALQADGKIIAAGLAKETPGGPTRSVIARIFTEDVLAIQEKNQVIEKVYLYPNPAKGQVQLDYFLPEKTELRINLYDIQGRLVQH